MDKQSHLKESQDNSVSRRLLEEASRLFIPIAAMLELTYQCNLSCRHCFISVNGEKELSLIEIYAILDQLKEAGLIYLGLTGGEIFVRKDFCEIAQYARKKGFVITLLTNGTLITPRVADQIKDLRPFGVEISVHGATAKTHDFVTQHSGSFERTLKAIKLLVNRKIPVTIKTCLMNVNVAEIRDLKSMARTLGVSLRLGTTLAPKKDGNKEPQSYNISLQQLRTFGSDFSDEVVPECGFGDDLAKKLVCKAGRAVCSITPKGDINPCIMMPIKVGNLRLQKFTEVWQREAYGPLRSLRCLEPANLSCAKCEKLFYCVRCPGVAYLETGDIKSPSPFACEVAEWREEIKPLLKK